MRRVFVLPSFERSLKKLTIQEKKEVAQSLERFNEFLLSGTASFGFRFKKINHDKYEFRAGIRLRVAVKIEGNNFYLALAGNHNDIARYLKEYRNK